LAPAGVVSTAVGYAAGHTPNPTYDESCSGRTGHTEFVRVVWKPSRWAFSDLPQAVLGMPTTHPGHGQGHDHGSRTAQAIVDPPTPTKLKPRPTPSGPPLTRASSRPEVLDEITTGNRGGSHPFFFARNPSQPIPGEGLAGPPMLPAGQRSCELAPFQQCLPAGSQSVWEPVDLVGAANACCAALTPDFRLLSRCQPFSRADRSHCLCFSGCPPRRPTWRWGSPCGETTDMPRQFSLPQQSKVIVERNDAQAALISGEICSPRLFRESLHPARCALLANDPATLILRGDELTVERLPMRIQ